MKKGKRTYVTYQKKGENTPKKTLNWVLKLLRGAGLISRTSMLALRITHHRALDLLKIL